MNRIGEESAKVEPTTPGSVTVWRITHKCPACLNPWSYDILEPGPEPAIPDDVKLGPWMLCGSCEARRRVSYRQIQGGKTEWQAPFWGEEQDAQLWARVRSQAGTFTSVHPLGEYRGQKLLDEKSHLVKILTRISKGHGIFRNLVSITSEEYIPFACKWQIPRRPNAPTVGGWK